MTLGRLLDNLHERQWEVQLIAPYRSDRVDDVADFEYCPVRAFRIPKYPDLRFGYPAVGKIKKLWQTNPPDIIHIATEGPLGWAAARAAKQLGRTYISSFHTNFHEYGSHYGFGFGQKLVLNWLRNFHNKGALTFAPSQDLITKLEADGFANMRLLSRGIDTQLYSPSRRSNALRAEWGAQADTPVVIYVGRVAEEKNIPLTIKAWQEMKKIHPNTKFVVVGDGPPRKRLEKEFPEILFVGSKRGEELAAYYASADCFLFASTTETFGNVVTEAMASGLVVLAYHYAAPAQFITSGTNGFTVPFNDEAAFLAATVEIANRKSEWKQIAAKAVESTAHRSWASIFDLFLKDLSSLLPSIPIRNVS